MVQLFRGSIFDSKCDLLIVPCNSSGEMTYSVHKELSKYNLPQDIGSVPAGGVFFYDAFNSSSNASMVAYAASVDLSRLDETNTFLRQIAKTIKNYCQEHSLNKVNIPLLGTGAGGLPSYASYEVLKETFSSLPNILLCVYVLQDDIYEELIQESTSTPTEIKNPRVFISYTATDPKNRDWVKKLACRLRESGIDARLDLFHLKPGQDLPQWMTNEVIMADKVLLICDQNYAKKADNRKGGVGWETMLIQGDLLANQVQNKYIIIQRDKDVDQSLPIYVKSRYALNWSDDAQIDKEFNDLLFYLFDCDIEPPIGSIPEFIIEKLKSDTH